jgi:ATP-binding cassette subfamily B protein
MRYRNKKKKSFTLIIDDIKLMWRAVKKYHKIEKTLFPLIIINSIFTAIQPFIMIFLSGLLIDELSKGENVKHMLIIALAGLTAQFIVGIANCYIGKIKWVKFRNMAGYQGYLLCEKMMNMDFEYIEDAKIQDKVRIQTEYTESFQGAYTIMFQRLNDCIQMAITICISLVAVIPMFLRTGRDNTLYEKIINSPLLSLALFLILGLGVLYCVRSSKTLQRVGKDNQEQLIKLNRRFLYFFTKFLDGYDKGKDVRIFRMNQIINKECEMMQANSNSYCNTMTKLSWRFQIISQPISTLTAGIVYLFLGVRAITGAISVGNIVSYAGCIQQFASAFSDLLINYSALRINNEYLRELLIILELKPQKQIGTIPVEKRSDNRYKIECQHVSFRYPGTKDYVIKDLNITFDIGEKMAVVGKNGSGKTTFIKLLCRLYDPTEGSILLNGVDIRKYDYQEYLKIFAVVFQDSKIYSFPVGNNISASESYEEARVMDAIHRAGLDELYEKLPDGLRTCVYQDFDKQGIDISGGEAQKMEIARSIYCNRPFAIMDEPTAALDPIAEHKVFTGFNEMVGSKTAIYISHRLSSCRFCNDIIVFDQGKVVQRGRHEQLVNADGLYKVMWNAQAQYYLGTQNEAVYQ